MPGTDPAATVRFESGAHLFGKRRLEDRSGRDGPRRGKILSHDEGSSGRGMQNDSHPAALWPSFACKLPPCIKGLPSAGTAYK